MEPIDKIDIEYMHLPVYDIMRDVVGRLNNELNKQLEDAFIDGLKRKGFEFKHRFELEVFVKEHCRSEDYVQSKQRVYFVDDIPFLLHNYKTEIITDPRITGDPNKVVGKLGTFAYL